METIHGLGYVEHLSYLGFFIAVGLSGYAIPIPEEVLLILGGFLSAEGILHLPLVMISSILGAICGDSLIFYLSGHGSRFTQKYQNRMEKSQLGWYLRQLKNNPSKTIFFSRFIVGMRFFNPLVSGLMKIKARIFIPAAALSAAIYIPVIVWIGYYFHNNIHRVIHIAESVRQLIIGVLVAGSVILIALFFKNLWKKPKVK